MEEKSPERSARIGLRQVTIGILLVTVVIFILQNLYRVRVQLVFFHAAAPLWLVIIATLVIGYVIGRFSVRR